jgi:two-component system response regulator YesN
MYKVMIVDDMDIIRRMLKKMPIWGESPGFELRAEARNGQEALEMLRQEEMDLVITDIKMPKVDGLELLKKINDKKLAKCVVLLSDYTDFSFARQGMVLGAFDYLAKPAGAGELAKMLARVRERLDEKNREAQRLQSMEKKLEEKGMAFFPSADVDQLIRLILAGDEAASGLAARIADFSSVSLEGEPIRMEFLLKSILNAVWNGVLEKKGWLCAFMDRNDWIRSEGLRSVHVEEIKNAFLERTEYLGGLIRKLECSGADNEVVRRMCSFVLENVDGEMSLKSLSEKLFMNRTYLSEVFRQKTGQQFVEYLTMVKMERAKILLGEGRLRTYEIAEKLGFRDIEYFSRLFKRYAGMPPMEYRQRIAVP